MRQKSRSKSVGSASKNTVKAPKLPLAYLGPQHLDPWSPAEWPKRKPESYVRKIRLLTEKHDEWRDYATSPSLIVPEFSTWRGYRKRFERQSRSPAHISASLCAVASEIDSAAFEGESPTLDQILSDLAARALPLPLSKGWVEVAEVAFEVAQNAAHCWNYKVGNLLLRDSTGLAFRMMWSPTIPPHWESAKIQRPPYWAIELDRERCILAPDWFWRGASVSTNTSTNLLQKLRPIALRVIQDYLVSLIEDLSATKADRNDLTAEPSVLSEPLAGIYDKGDLREPVGPFVKRLSKLALEAYDRMPQERVGTGLALWLPGFLPLPGGGE